MSVFSSRGHTSDTSLSTATTKCCGASHVGKTARTQLSCMLASGSNGPLSVLGGPETRQLTLGAVSLFGRTDEDNPVVQGNAVQPGGDLEVWPGTPILPNPPFS